MPPEHKGRLVVLVATGSYSPVHRMHVHMFEVAKKSLEEKYPSLLLHILYNYLFDSQKHGFHVVAGFISPSHDNYVESKLGNAYIPADHR